MVLTVNHPSFAESDLNDLITVKIHKTVTPDGGSEGIVYQTDLTVDSVVQALDLSAMDKVKLTGTWLKENWAPGKVWGMTEAVIETSKVPLVFEGPEVYEYVTTDSDGNSKSFMIDLSMVKITWNVKQGGDNVTYIDTLNGSVKRPGSSSSDIENLVVTGICQLGSTIGDPTATQPNGTFVKSPVKIKAITVEEELNEIAALITWNSIRGNNNEGDYNSQTNLATVTKSLELMSKIPCPKIPATSIPWTGPFDVVWEIESDDTFSKYPSLATSGWNSVNISSGGVVSSGVSSGGGVKRVEFNTAHPIGQPLMLNADYVIVVITAKAKRNSGGTDVFSTVPARFILSIPTAAITPPEVIARLNNEMTAQSLLIGSGNLNPTTITEDFIVQNYASGVPYDGTGTSFTWKVNADAANPDASPPLGLGASTSWTSTGTRIVIPPNTSGTEKTFYLHLLISVGYGVSVETGTAVFEYRIPPM
jgi:hypothetical protein